MKNKSIRCVSYPPWAWRYMPTGVERRLAIFDHILVVGGMYVNRKHCPQVAQDVDLKKMLKAGTLIQTRESKWGVGNSCNTVLRIGKPCKPS